MSEKTLFYLEVQPRIPSELSRLEDLASNLVYSWDRQVRGLFFRLDKHLWEKCGHNPKVFLNRVDQRKLQAAVEDPVYMQDYFKVISTFDTYLNRQMSKGLSKYLVEDKDLISYSCAEFGLHESLPIYSGGLGILAGDHCKAASDLGLPLVAMGILYRKGYFSQRIDASGNQIVKYRETEFAELPIRPVNDQQGEQKKFSIAMGNRNIFLQLWMAQVGHVTIYLMDSNLAENNSTDRKITHQLYGGDQNNRLLQEIVLGIGGVKAHRILGIEPTVWHINEGHAAFQIIERCRELVAQGMDFSAALEAVAANTVFTTHTPVAAGHDIFNHGLIQEYFTGVVEELGISMEHFLSLGQMPHYSSGFNMTALALRGSRHHNGVSKIHGDVASAMESYVWKDIPPDNNPMTYVTNGIHVPTFLASEWSNFFDMTLGGGWRNELRSRQYWHQIKEIPNHRFWSIRESLKAKMLEAVYDRLTHQLRRNGISKSQIKRMSKFINPMNTEILTVGFARRFATYKRATLVFADIERLQKIVSQAGKPVVFIFAGKAHPNDEPGQNLIRRINELSHDPRFEGRVVLLEDFDIALARKLVTGVDVWLNTPIHPLEASGTSGQKGGINGVLNLSILDGWWNEGYNGENGWGITAHDDSFSAEFRDKEENRELLDLLENEVIPLYYQRDGHGYSAGWIKKCKSAMETIIPHFNSERMVMDYVKNLYAPAAKNAIGYAEQEYYLAKELAQWKAKINREWSQVSIQFQNLPAAKIYYDETFHIEVCVQAGELDPSDLKVECLFGFEPKQRDSFFHTVKSLSYSERLEDGKLLYKLVAEVNIPGKQCCAIRVYPYHEALSHPFELGYLKWL